LASLFDIDKSNEYVLFVNSDNRETFCLGRENVQVSVCDIASRPQWKRVLWEQLALPISAKKQRIDLLHSPTYTWPVRSDIPGVVSILDMLYCVYPGSISRSKVSFWKVFVPLSARRCRKILTISENSKRDIVRFLGVPPEKVTVTPLALDRLLNIDQPPTQDDVDGVRAKYGIRKPYLLCVGGVGKHKNALALLGALEILRNRKGTEGLTLAIAGNDYGSADEIRREAVRHRLGDVVRLPGYVARRELPALYAGADAYVTASMFEGFGLTVLEAMAFRTPVIISDRTSLPEVAGDAALTADPERPESIADAVTRIVSSPETRRDLIRRGLRRIEEFSWQRTASLTLEAYREAVDASR